ncbi:hypothetical protein DQ04_06771000 [Trypanosoma grayi]|uniref:hypothetical protein n=1 Tax=Trypanosoma grayi TaxID=71804 RepID=UPI0004F49927|nr:hypothetical protein DQ04_06771000 [Trypanosoma grayi]KEG08628.1 hypothetical protein DQ04_06771000 [Trypanosoma grayi]
MRQSLLQTARPGSERNSTLPPPLSHQHQRQKQQKQHQKQHQQPQQQRRRIKHNDNTRHSHIDKNAESVNPPNIRRSTSMHLFHSDRCSQSLPRRATTPSMASASFLSSRPMTPRPARSYASTTLSVRRSGVRQLLEVDDSDPLHTRGLLTGAHDRHQHRSLGSGGHSLFSYRNGRTQDTGLASTPPSSRYSSTEFISMNGNATPSPRQQCVSVSNYISPSYVKENRSTLTGVYDWPVGRNSPSKQRQPSVKMPPSPAKKSLSHRERAPSPLTYINSHLASCTFNATLKCVDVRCPASRSVSNGKRDDLGEQNTILSGDLLMWCEGQAMTDAGGMEQVMRAALGQGAGFLTLRVMRGTKSVLVREALVR